MKNARVIKPFWTKYATDMSTKLWLPVKTDCQDSHLNSSTLSAKSLEQQLTSSNLPKNQKNQILPKILCQLSPFLPQDTTENVTIKYARKIRIYPNQNQKNLFKKCFNTSRFIYNKGVELINKQYAEKLADYTEKASKSCIFKECKVKAEDKNFFCEKHTKSKIKWDLPLTLPKLRPQIMKSDKDLGENEKWQAEVPYDTRQLALKSLIGNYKSAITNKQNGNIKNFELGFKRSKALNQVFFVNKKAMKEGLHIFKRRLKKKLKVKKKHKKYYNYTPKHDFIILKEHYSYYLVLPKERNTLYQKPLYNTVSLDPGVRTFQTCYSPEGWVGKLGSCELVEALQKKLDKFKSLRVSCNKRRTRNHLKRRCSLVITKLKNIVKNLHWQTCSLLVKNFQNIIIPAFKTKDIASQLNRKINKKTTRNMLGLGHFAFLEKLKFKCKEYQRNLHIVTEEYTSKTCGKCGNIDEKLGSSKVYKCKNCKLVIDRDVNGARNILIKHLISH